MNTLTQFIDTQLSLSHQLTAGEGKGNDEVNASGLYEIIENVEIKSRTFKGLAVSGSLFSLTTFTDVTFESCVFYASRFENCTFINCNFKDCKIEFSQLQHTNFNNCSFEGSFFSMSPLKKCTLAFCQFDYKFEQTLNKEENKVFNCSELAPLTWEDVLEKGMEEPAAITLGPTLSPNQEEDDDTGWFTALQDVFSKFKAA